MLISIIIFSIRPVSILRWAPSDGAFEERLQSQMIAVSILYCHAGLLSGTIYLTNSRHCREMIRDKVEDRSWLDSAMAYTSRNHTHINKQGS